jgi:hypothetical protein
MRGPLLQSAALAAAVLAGNLVVLTLFLNPEATLRRDGLGLALCLFLPYLLAGTGALTAAALAGDWALDVRDGRRGRVLPAHPWFAALCCLASTLAALVFWSNLWAYGHALPLPVLRGLLASTFVLAGAALVLLVLGLDAVLFPRHGRGVPTVLAILAAAAGVIVPLALRPDPVAEPRPVPLNITTRPPARRVVLVGVDGLGPETLREVLATGSPTALAALLSRGASGPLSTLRPTEGPPLWATVFTGKLPRHHGVKGFVSYRLRLSRSNFDLLPKWAGIGALEHARLVTRRAAMPSTARRGPALWSALNAFGISAGAVRFWGTHPAERVQGFMLTPHFHTTSGAAQTAALHPANLAWEVRARRVTPADVDAALVGEFLDPEGAGDPWRQALVTPALAPDLSYQRAAAMLREAHDPAFFGFAFHGLDAVGHDFLRFDRPEMFGNVTAEEQRRYGRVRDRYLAFVARWLDEQADALREGDVLLVVSTYGMEPVPLWRRLLLPGARRSGTHEGAPPGMLVAVGGGIRPGARIEDASLLDLCPTILYLMGLPVARDMEGRVLSGMIEESLLRSQPVSFIPSYASLAVTPPVAEDLPPPPEEP